MRIALAQLDQAAGDIAANLARVRAASRAAMRSGASLVVASLRSPFDALASLAGEAGDARLIVGFVDDAGEGCALLRGGCIDGIARPDAPCVVDVEGLPIGLVCGDAWHGDPARRVRTQGARMVAVTERSPYRVDAHASRTARAAACALENALPVVYVNRVGSDGTFAFDGASFVIDATGALAQQLPAWHETIAIASFGHGAPRVVRGSRNVDVEGDLYHALMSAVRSRVGHGGGAGVRIGASGDLAAALMLVAAADALGRERVLAIASANAIGVAHEIARFTGVRCERGGKASPGFEPLPADLVQDVLSRAAHPAQEARSMMLRLARYRDALGRFAPDRLLVSAASRQAAR